LPWSSFHSGAYDHRSCGGLELTCYDWNLHVDVGILTLISAIGNSNKHAMLILTSNSTLSSDLNPSSVNVNLSSLMVECGDGVSANVPRPRCRTSMMTALLACEPVT
jgi:hypothetical protein